MNQGKIAILSTQEIRKIYEEAFNVLNVSDYLFVDNDGGKHRMGVLNYPQSMLGSMAHSADELCNFVFGVRIFPNAIYVINSKTPTGIVLSEYDLLDLDQRKDPDLKSLLSIPAASEETMTAAQRMLIVCQSVVDSVGFDHENKVAGFKVNEYKIHVREHRNKGLSYKDGSILSLLPQEMCAISYLLDDNPEIALNHVAAHVKDVRKKMDQGNVPSPSR